MPPPLALIAESHRRLTGRDLVPPGGDPAEALWAAPAAIVAHGTEPDPLFFYANQAALSRFEMPLERFIGMPSRLSAEPMHQGERDALLARVRRHGFIEDYAGIRISATGHRFRIEHATVWNLVDTTGTIHGQAAAFEHRVDLVD